MKVCTVEELQQNLEEFVEMVETGEEFVVYDSGKAVAKIVAYTEESDRL